MMSSLGGFCSNCPNNSLFFLQSTHFFDYFPSPRVADDVTPGFGTVVAVALVRRFLVNTKLGRIDPNLGKNNSSSTRQLSVSSFSLSLQEDKREERPPGPRSPGYRDVSLSTEPPCQKDDCHDCMNSRGTIIGSISGTVDTLTLAADDR